MDNKQFNEAQFEKLLEKAVDILKEEICEKGLPYLGEECIKRIREQGRENDWTDQTGNLRSSIGYAIFEYGREVMKSTFEQVKDGKEGVEKGNQYIDSLAQQYAKVYALVVVAGMDYAGFVEDGGEVNRRPRDVLASTEIWAKDRINKVLEVYKEIAERRINALIK